MKKTTTHNSITGKFTVMIIFFLIIMTADFLYVLHRVRGLEVYDELHYKLMTLSTEVVKFEFALDVLVVTRGLKEKRTENLFVDMKRIEAIIGDIREPRYKVLFVKDSTYFDFNKGMLEGWNAVSKEMELLEKSRKPEELYLLHNEIDTRTFILSSNIRRMMSLVSTHKVSAYAGIRRTAFIVLTLTCILWIIIACFFYMSVLSPVRRLIKGLARPGEPGGRFNENLFPEQFRQLINSFNSDYDYLRESLERREKSEQGLKRELLDAKARMQSLNVVNTALGASLSTHEIFMKALKGAMNVTGAFAGSVYLKEGETLRLRVSKGFSSAFSYKAEKVPCSERPDSLVTDAKPVIYGSIEDVPHGGYRSALTSEDVISLVATPVVTDGKVAGWFDLAFKEKKTVSQWDEVFLKAMASNIHVSLSFSEFFCHEFEKKAFLERLTSQLPFGFAVFNIDGICTHVNHNFLKLISRDVKADFVGRYNIFDDKEFALHGVMPFIEKSFEGRAMRFIITYEGPLSKGEGKELTARCYPIFEVTGNVENIGLILEETKSSGQ